MLNQKIKYLLAGAWNTLFGYIIANILYELLSKYFDIIVIGIVINLVTITSAFLVYKLFVFRSKGKWLVEYFRCMLVYGWAAIFGIFMLWLMVENMKVKFFIAQAIITLLTVCISYFLHNKFTFKK